MSVGFGRVVVDGSVVDDPYDPEIEALARFEILSDDGATYRIEAPGRPIRSAPRTRMTWTITRVAPSPAQRIGTVTRGGNVANRWYSYTREGRWFAAGQQNTFINAVFGAIGLDDDLGSPRPLPDIDQDEDVQKEDVQKYVANELLSRLVGYQMHSVEFVMDYVQLHFQSDAPDNPYLICFAWPSVAYEGSTFHEPDPGYADALRALVTEEVEATKEATGIGLRIEFASGSITLHPRIEDVQVEIAMLSGFADRQWMVWRPGEESFEDVSDTPSDAE